MTPSPYPLPTTNLHPPLTAPFSRPENPILLICDLQEKFRPVISSYTHVLATTRKTIKFAHLLQIPIHVTTQSAAKLGPICSELTSLLKTGSTPVVVHDKTRFSMVVPALLAELPAPPATVAIVGIEAHICVTQTALDLLQRGYGVYVLADGVSSCNAGDTGLALHRLEKAGAVVVSSEGWVYEVMGDAGLEQFRAVAGVIKEAKDETRDAVEALCKI